jgi:hypothetical protein
MDPESILTGKPERMKDGAIPTRAAFFPQDKTVSRITVD